MPMIVPTGLKMLHKTLVKFLFILNYMRGVLIRNYLNKILKLVNELLTNIDTFFSKP